jgi:hypothetical protein
MKEAQWGTANAQPITLSFVVMSNVIGTFSGAIRKSDAAMAYPFEFTINFQDLWLTKTITIPGPTTGTWPTAEGTSFLDIWINAGTGTTFAASPGSWVNGNYIGTTNPGASMTSVAGRYLALSSVQLELGSVPTKFEHTHIQDDLVRCMRYLQRYDTWPLIGLVTGNTYVSRASFNLPVTMAKAPTVTLTTPRYATTSLIAGMTTSIANNFSQKDACQIEFNMDTGMNGKVAIFANVEGNSPVYLTA